MTIHMRAEGHLKLPGAKPDGIRFDPAKSALVVVDMQNAYASQGGYLDIAGFDLTGVEGVIARISGLVREVREAGMQIVFLQNGWDADYKEAGGPLAANQFKSNALRVMRERPELEGQLLSKGGWDYALVDALSPVGTDIVVPKSRYSGFVGTPLDSILRSRGIRHLFVVGVATNVCVETTIRDAFGLEYHAVMVTDCCHQAGPRYVHDATIFNVETFFGWTITSDDLGTALQQR